MRSDVALGLLMLTFHQALCQQQPWWPFVSFRQQFPCHHAPASHPLSQGQAKVDLWPRPSPTNRLYLFRAKTLRDGLKARLALTNLFGPEVTFGQRPAAPAPPPPPPEAPPVRKPASVLTTAADAMKSTTSGTTVRITPMVKPEVTTEVTTERPSSTVSMTSATRSGSSTSSSMSSTKEFSSTGTTATAGTSRKTHVCEPGGKCHAYTRSFQTGEPLFQYAYAHSSQLHPVLQEIYEDTRSLTYLPLSSHDALVAPEVVTFSMGLIRALRANRVLVIGVFTGLAVVGAALAMEPDGGQVVGVDEPDALKYWDSVGGRLSFKAGLAKNVIMQATFPIHDYLENLASVQPNTFDLVILDDPKMTNYDYDYEKGLTLLRPNGIMLINDVLCDGNVLSGTQYQDRITESMDSLNRKLRNDGRVHTTALLPIGGGLTMVVKK